MNIKSDPGYPDDIRSYDNHPDSPFYVDPHECSECGGTSEEWVEDCTRVCLDCGYVWTVPVEPEED